MKSATRFLKRFACLALAAILSLTCLAACGGGEGGGSRSPAAGHFKGGDISEASVECVGRKIRYGQHLPERGASPS